LVWLKGWTPLGRIMDPRLPPKRPRGGGLWRCTPGRACVIGYATVTLGLLGAGMSFTGNPLSLRTSRSVGNRAAERQLNTRTWPADHYVNASAGRTWGSTALAWQCFGSALLLWGCRTQSKRAAARPAARCSFGGSTLVCVDAKGMAPPPQTSPEGLVATPTISVAEPLLDLLATSTQPAQTAPPLHLPKADAGMATHQGLYEPAGPTAAHGPKRCGRAALLAGGARFARRRHASRRNSSGRSRGAARAAHRTVGARLQPAWDHPEQRTAFDPSRLRTKLQDGLRVLVHMSSEHVREAKAASMSAGLCDEMNVVLVEQKEDCRCLFKCRSNRC